MSPFLSPFCEMPWTTSSRRVSRCLPDAWKSTEVGSARRLWLLCLAVRGKVRCAVLGVSCVLGWGGGGVPLFSICSFDSRLSLMSLPRSHIRQGSVCLFSLGAPSLFFCLFLPLSSAIPPPLLSSILQIAGPPYVHAESDCFPTLTTHSYAHCLIMDSLPRPYTPVWFSCTKR